MDKNREVVLPTLHIEPFVTCATCSPPKNRRCKQTLKKHYFSDCFVCLKAKSEDDPLLQSPGGIVGLYLRKGETLSLGKGEIESKMRIAAEFGNTILLSPEFLSNIKHDLCHLFYSSVDLYKIFLSKLTKHYGLMYVYSSHRCNWRPEVLHDGPQETIDPQHQGERPRRSVPLDNWDMENVENATLTCVMCNLTRSKREERLWMNGVDDEHWMNRSFLFDPNPLDPFNVCLEMQCPSTRPTVFCRWCWPKLQNTELLKGIKKLFWELGPLAVDGQAANMSKECRKWVGDVWQNNVF